jgi:hypothetical protein
VEEKSAMRQHDIIQKNLENNKWMTEFYQTGTRGIAPTGGAATISIKLGGNIAPYSSVVTMLPNNIFLEINKPTWTHLHIIL